MTIETCTLVGIKADGTEHVIGNIPVPPRMKFKEILRSYFSADPDDEDSDAALALFAFDDLVAWQKKEPAQPGDSLALQELTTLIRHHTDPEAFQEIRNALIAFAAGQSQPAAQTVGYKLVPIEPTEEMIRAGCLNQQTHPKYTNYDDWWNSNSGGVSERIRKMLSDDYKAMIGVAPLSDTTSEWEMKPIEWSEVKEPNEQCRYDHVSAECSLGSIMIEWKGWKDSMHVRTVYIAGDYCGSADTLEDAKELAMKQLYDKIKPMLK